MTTFPETMKYYRAAYRVSQQAAAEGSQYDKSFISRLESGERKPSRDVILRLAEGIGLSADDTDKLLLSASFAPVQVKSLLRHPELAQVDDLMSAATPDARERASKTIQDVIAVLSMNVKDRHALATG